MSTAAIGTDTLDAIWPMPKSNLDFWSKKFARNVERDGGGAASRSDRPVGNNL